MNRNSTLRRVGFKRKTKEPHRYGFKRSKGLKAGRKVKAWEATRRELKVKYAAMGITSCELRYEGCKRDDWLSFAHGRKRRKLEGDELSTLTILACTPCHAKIEFLPADEMLRIIESVITNRKAAA
jgi:hypothetical protein